MSEENQTITINDEEYKLDELSDKASAMLAQCLNLDGQINELKFKLDQLSVARESFGDMLDAQLKKDKHTE